ncbi:50S ribosomal protein L5 [Candidatus Woesearchaeota archaeon CG_4_10_14_0_2_um_filter_33_10]|nr:MAG: 50S ribosomal protein L5 [Candidatus Woesearchaeota archaeon CG1_02_33_12]PIN78358.1 MAG: 50S ribosomal protein L5 [Candidatus Woesearchaeota archaeon CG10_big_fil_rev_8_21_14_0_10_33_12]PIU72586.1 MAG: 50S ribosomal protein L5 [Candidatus Woesearchaeota archaeon CG06_land_8_20_14_3_00_33_13]PIZ53277.1 MAG: 50S ribosomal protein L5 [Candidatus Woesearchaeota archaeon CG_4_10_14_0_2_um_filter_33_10]
MNPSRDIKISKVTLNIGAGKDQTKLDKGIKLFKSITNVSPVKTITSKRIPGWGLRPGLPIGCKVTLRKKNAIELLKRLLQAKDTKLKESQFDNNGNIAFGIEEYIDIPGVKYDPEIGIIGLEVCITLERNGFRIKRRRIAKKKIPKKHMITKQDAIDFMKKEFNIGLEGD